MFLDIIFKKKLIFINKLYFMESKEDIEKKVSEYIEDMDKVILQRIIAERKAKKVSQTDIANLIGLSPQQWYQIENGLVRLNLKNAIAVLKFLDINIFENAKTESPTIDFLKQLQESKDSLFELREVLIENLKAVNAFIQAPKEKNPNNRETQINLKATEEEKNTIIQYAKENGMSLIDSFINLVGEKQNKKKNE